MQPIPEEDHEEVDVTELIGRIENLEKENIENKKTVESLEKRVIELESFAEAASDTIAAISRR